MPPADPEAPPPKETAIVPANPVTVHCAAPPAPSEAFAPASAPDAEGTDAEEKTTPEDKLKAAKKLTDVMVKNMIKGPEYMKKIATKSDGEGGRVAFWKKKRYDSLQVDEEEAGEGATCELPQTRGDWITYVFSPMLACFNMFVIFSAFYYIIFRKQLIGPF